MKPVLSCEPPPTSGPGRGTRLLMTMQTLLLSIVLTACSGYGAGTNNSNTPNTSVSGYGVVESIELVNRDEAGLNLGTVAGAVVGGLLGNQVGEGRGRTAATVLGAAGGAYAGQKIEQNRRAADQVYRMRIRLNDGSVATLVQDTNLNLRVGDRVRVVSGSVQPY